MMGEELLSPLLFERGGKSLESFWFKHHIDSYKNKQHVMLRKKYGIQGYGLFWYLIEIIASEEGRLLELNEFSIGMLSTETLCEEEFIFEYIHDAIEVNLLQYAEIDNEAYIYSEWLNEMLEVLDNLMAKRSSAGTAGAEARWKKTIEKKTFSADSIEIGLAKIFVSKLKEVAPEVWMPRFKKDWQRWAYEFDKMIRLDNRLPDHIKIVINYGLTNEFWRDKVLDPPSIRKHFDKLYQQQKSNDKPFVKPASHKLLED